jgi:hypothetical protein
VKNLVAAHEEQQLAARSGKSQDDHETLARRMRELKAAGRGR